MLKAIIRYHVHDVHKFLFEVMHANDVLVYTTQGIIRDIVERTTWEKLDDVNDIITREVKVFVKKWGITIEKITITDLAIVKTFRILGDTEKTILPTET